MSDSQEAVGSSFQNDNRGADPTNLGARNILFLFLVVFASGGILAWFAWWEWMKRRKMTGPKAESDGSEEKICPTCGGSGKIKEKVRKSAPCDHCKKTGRDICHYCSGTGRYGVGLVVPETEDDIQNFMKCDYCEGSGFKNPPLPCCFCKGERKIWYDEWYEKTCPKCKGTGRV
ncbi:MAG: hypothetical protein A3A30_04020 [Candidatus Terrybacteria bacterium RIFCSPLOWO2_01_FULL_48_14]|nr:MAG: hypothetical protein A3A30_04020 [Candidatus Terrybacteria bacterium RIFCSPLOWO2_01_FULL_48_14]